MSADPAPPAHLAEETAAWWSDVVAEYELEPHHVRLLTLAAEAWDRGAGARELIEVDGAVVADRFGQLKTHPAVAIERDARIAFARLVRELCLDESAPGEVRPPRAGGRA